MSYSIVQDISGATDLTGQVQVDSGAITVTAGNALIAVVINFDITEPVALSDTVGTNDTWTEIGTERIFNSLHARAFYLLNAAAGSSNIRAVFGAFDVVNYPAIYVAEVSGLSAFDDDAFAGNTAPGTGTDAISSGNTATLASQPALILGVAVNETGTTAPAAGTGFTDRGAFFALFSSNIGRVEHKRVTATTAVPATFTASVGSDNYGTLALVFTESGAAPDVISRPMYVT